MSADLGESLAQLLETDHYRLLNFDHPQDFLAWVGQDTQRIDCVVLEATPAVAEVIPQLCNSGTLLPAIVLDPDPEAMPAPDVNAALANLTPAAAALEHPTDSDFYHHAEVRLTTTNLSEIIAAINLAISRFLDVATKQSLTEYVADENFLLRKQQQLVDKLKERLGYLGVYYKRDPKRFLRHMSKDDRTMTLDRLKSIYRYIVLNYFSPPADLNEKIDEFVNLAFFSDISVTQIVEIHMELMDEFAKQLKLEGRSDEILLDYRLTLIDTIAHLCEMYRRSIPRES